MTTTVVDLDAVERAIARRQHKTTAPHPFIAKFHYRKTAKATAALDAYDDAHLRRWQQEHLDEDRRQSE